MNTYRCKCGFKAFVNIGSHQYPEYLCYACFHALRKPKTSSWRMPTALQTILEQEKQEHDNHIK
jgi:hypothetical protein